jgi:ubiquitin related modifier 1
VISFNSGGMELLFDNKKQIEVTLDDKEMTMVQFIDYLKKNHLKDKEEMFVSGSSVRPGIIVLVNDTDWELLDTVNYKIEDKDNIAFISTLHGG